mmetsp:Transcript_10365/g.15953  ORF Transcript_10365/g.15953 Transcript_10365/m.15953 type:complete len:94 (-) Transcript_10365:589-870(-)|eukprot:CAMPEP_0170512374 /NCGR_PEP_ID=MMETSP0208-20121228/66811_1 /TAXON_ID=197538 /ORGANISM="Strombidium inclinatum, Strain S3" /LENGTH=93 /DNA_ID=CAMNT_0010795995 /DNA_START=4657 /DNA_END=4938 /DNA_ORIENTATION=+
MAEAFENPSKPAPQPKSETLPASPASMSPPTEGTKDTDDSHPFHSRLLMLEEYHDMKMPLVRKFEMGVDKNLQTFARQMAFSLLHSCQDRFLA